VGFNHQKSEIKNLAQRGSDSCRTEGCLRGGSRVRIAVKSQEGAPTESLLSKGGGGTIRAKSLGVVQVGALKLGRKIRGRGVVNQGKGRNDDERKKCE